jgi:hypothetical protein
MFSAPVKAAFPQHSTPPLSVMAQVTPSVSAAIATTSDSGGKDKGGLSVCADADLLFIPQIKITINPAIAGTIV